MIPFLYLVLCLCWFSPPVVHSGGGKEECVDLLTYEQQRDIVDQHNYDRIRVYPPAADMLKLVLYIYIAN